MDVLDALEELIDQSLVRVEDRGSVTRYHVLETVRQFGARYLSDQPAAEREAVVRRHADWYPRLLKEVGPWGEGRRQRACLDRLLPERDDLNAALRHFQNEGDAERLADVALSASPFWKAAELPADGRTWSAAALDLLGDRRTDLRVGLVNNRAMHMFLAGELFTWAAVAQEGLALATEIGDRFWISRAQRLLAGIPIDPIGSLALLTSAAADSNAVGDLYGEALALQGRARLYAGMGWRQAAEALVEAQRVVDQLGDPWVTETLNSWRVNAAIHIADHASMRAALDPESPRFVRASPLTESLLAMIELRLAGDFGAELPDPEPLAARALHFARIENYLALYIQNQIVALVLHARGELARALTLSDSLAEQFAGMAIANLHGATLAFASEMSTVRCDAWRRRTSRRKTTHSSFGSSGSSFRRCWPATTTTLQPPRPPSIRCWPSLTNTNSSATCSTHLKCSPVWPWPRGRGPTPRGWPEQRKPPAIRTRSEAGSSR